ncbi:unnamed protein product [Haemonchus placei]|uniref:Activin_recp domain-containing protein n=1 Tax=Haemonchus placei TaxID=6290 RepID=A0A0N4WHN5_HAEPC|nr:unnamed protein product [Haemonchus placei]
MSPLDSDVMQSLLVLFSFLFVRSSSLLCNQCGGERYSGGLRLLRGMCCNVSTVECAAGLICLRAMVVSPRRSFILSGCHIPEDGLIGCDFHHLPHNATIHRCVCLDQTCQSYFPMGNCSLSTSSPATTTMESRPNQLHRKSHALNAATTIQTETTTSITALTTSSPQLAPKVSYHAERTVPISYSSSQASWRFSLVVSSILVVLNALNRLSN